MPVTAREWTLRMERKAWCTVLIGVVLGGITAMFLIKKYVGGTTGAWWIALARTLSIVLIVWIGFKILGATTYLIHLTQKEDQ